MLAPSLQMKRRANHDVGDGIRVDLLCDGLCFGVRSCFQDVKETSQAVPGNPCAELFGNFDRHVLFRRDNQGEDCGEGE